MTRLLSQPEIALAEESPVSVTPQTEKSGVRPSDGFFRQYVVAANEVRILVRGVRTPDMDPVAEETNLYDPVAEERIQAKLAQIPEGQGKADAMLALIDEIFEADQRSVKGEKPPKTPIF